MFSLRSRRRDQNAEEARLKPSGNRTACQPAKLHCSTASVSPPTRRQSEGSITAIVVSHSSELHVARRTHKYARRASTTCCNHLFVDNHPPWLSKRSPLQYLHLLGTSERPQFSIPTTFDLNEQTYDASLPFLSLATSERPHFFPPTTFHPGRASRHLFTCFKLPSTSESPQFWFSTVLSIRTPLHVLQIYSFPVRDLAAPSRQPFIRLEQTHTTSPAKQCQVPLEASA